ncbi:uncharacterized protein LOC117316012 [Pecten maximus]|uniref:uncharacterized protein LOC117316012 n=1 Tax=Pecten maximus TaxID=6579 RepID=UPI001459077D|nr:uncharacterized protein LOC117316012 [Pecten maximus]
MNWTSAEEYCEELNGRLIVLDSQEKLDNLTSHDQYKANYMDEERYWTGMRFNDSVRCDLTKDSNPWVYTGWGRWENEDNEPNWCPRQQCVKLGLNLMSSALCKSRYRVLCETEMVHTTAVQDQTITSSTELVEVNDTRSTDTSTDFSISEPEPSYTVSIATSRTEADMTSYDPTTSVMSAITTGAALVPFTAENHTCGRCCSSQNVTSRTLDQYELEESIAALRAQLTVNKTELSAYKRKLISVYDSRPSSVVMGSVACAILVTVIGVIVLPDVLALGLFMCRRLQTQHKILII